MPTYEEERRTWLKFWNAYTKHQRLNPRDPTPEEIKTVRRGVGKFGPGILVYIN